MNFMIDYVLNINYKFVFIYYFCLYDKFIYLIIFRPKIILNHDKLKLMKIGVFKLGVKYMYSLFYPESRVTVWEREPCRYIKIGNPDECKHK